MELFGSVVKNMKIAVKLILILLLTSIATVTYNLQSVKTSDGAYIYIKADGSIYPLEAEALINTTDHINYRILVNIINKSIIVERDDITIQGYNHIVRGNISLKIGIDLTGRKNVTLDHIKVTQFSYGVLLNSTQDCKLLYNTVWENWAGIWIQSSLRATVNYNNVSNNNMFGIRLYSVGNCEFNCNTLCFNYDGINSWYSNANEFISNNASANLNTGILLYISGAGNWLINNIVDSNKGYGISLYECDNNWLSGNNASGNRFNFGIDGTYSSDFTTHHIDTTNTVNGKPVYYVRGESDTVYDYSTNAGTIYLINCKNVTVKNLNLTNNGCGIFLWNATESKIENVSASKNNYGINIRNSRNNTFSQNSIAENQYGILVKNSNSSSIHHSYITSNQWGIHMEDSASNSIHRNIINSNMADGIYLKHSHNNTIIENTIVKNGEFFFPDPPIYFGINLQNSSNNTIYHNNLVDNWGQADAVSSYNNKWDNGYPSGGNHWSDHNNVDLNEDAVANDIYVIHYPNVDAYPLTGMFYVLETPQDYDVETVCNSTIDSITYSQSNHTITIIVSNMTSTQTSGFCRLTIPHNLILPEYQVIVNGTLVTPVLLQNNGTHSMIYVSYKHSTVEIIVIPEFTPTILMLLLAFSTTLSMASKKKTKTKDL